MAGSGGISGLAGVLFFAWLKRRIGREVTLIGVCAGGTLVVMLAYLASTNPVLSISLIFVSSFFGLGTLPLFWSVAMSRMSGLMAAAGLAFINMLGITGGFVGPYVYGLIEQATGSLRAPYYVIVVAACIGLAFVPVLALSVRRERAREDAVTPGEHARPTPA
ncbi:MFS transporter [Sphaerisporangium dianthi]|uniref:MFS transporter n=1 Tax=Sphaerisporangium dianthi TaxID=1436120 RepID=A0ABV9C919_9ACTN